MHVSVGGYGDLCAYSLPLPDLIQSLLPITRCKIFNIVVSLQMWAHLWENRVIAVKCDNESAVYVCNTGKTKDPFLNMCLHRIWYFTARYNIDLRVSHIQGCRNVTADALSRRKFDGLQDLQWDYLSPLVLLSLFRVETQFTSILRSRVGQVSSVPSTSHKSSV